MALRMRIPQTLRTPTLSPPNPPPLHLQDLPSPHPPHNNNQHPFLNTLLNTFPLLGHLATQNPPTIQHPLHAPRNPISRAPQNIPRRLPSNPGSRNLVSMDRLPLHNPRLALRLALRIRSHGPSLPNRPMQHLRHLFLLQHPRSLPRSRSAVPESTSPLPGHLFPRFQSFGLDANR